MIFERPARQEAAKNLGGNLSRTSSIFEWPTRQKAANSHGQNLHRTSSIFEKPSRQQASKDQKERVNPPPTLQTPDEKTKHGDSAETGANPSGDRRSNDNPPPLIGRTLADKYTIESVIGTGSMGTIYRARQIALDKWVAVKILHQELAEQQNFVERFKREAFSASRLEHPNSLRVLDFGEDGNLLHLVMEYVEADDLLTVMQREWPFTDARIVQIMSQALAALAKAHDVGIVHRDIKPENILILRGTDDEGNATDIVKVCDFGIAKMAVPSDEASHLFAPQLTTQGLVLGTPDYMSPEQARAEYVDGRSDLYSMGVVLYHLLCGRPPFNADTPFGIAIQHVSEPPIAPSRHRAVNPVLERICLRAMNKRPEDRFQTAREMRRAILSSLALYPESVMASDSAAPTKLQVRRPVSPSTLSVPNWLRRPNAVIAAAALVMVATLAVASVIARLRGEVSSWGSGNVVRTATVALTPAPPANTASSKGVDPARTQPNTQTPSLIPDDMRRPVTPSESEWRARPATAPSPATRH